MTRDDILELQKVYTDNYEKTIKPLYDEARRLEIIQKEEFGKALDKYFDTIFIDKNGISIRVGDTIEITEYQITGIGGPSRLWHTDLDSVSLAEHGMEYPKTGKSRNRRYICKDRKVQFIFGEMLNNPRIYCSMIVDGKKNKREVSFNPKECNHFEIIQQIN